MMFYNHIDHNHIEFLHVSPLCAPSGSLWLLLCNHIAIDCNGILIPHVVFSDEYPSGTSFLLYTRIECLSKGGDLGQPHRSSDKKEQSCSLGLGLDTWVMTCSII